MSAAGEGTSSAPSRAARETSDSPFRQRAVGIARTDLGLLLLALVVGAGGGLGAVAFRSLITAFTWLLTGHQDYSALGRVGDPHLPWLGPAFVVFAPVIAGIVYGPLIYRFAREARGHGVPEVMYAVARRGGRIGPQVALVKALASALCIGGGGSVGREGPIVQIGSALGSTVGRLSRVGTERMRLLVACGAAAGISATFNAPLAGVFFAMELILRDFAARSFGMVVVSSVAASLVGQSFLGNNPFLQLPGFSVHHDVDYAFFVVLGVVGGLVGVLFSKVLYAIEDLCDAAWHGWEWARPAVGGLLLGLLLLALPQMYGVGYPVLGNSVAGQYGVWFLIALALGKMVATSLTIGIGGSGGVFAPSLFIGAMVGSAFGQFVHSMAPSIAGPSGMYALVAMGAVFAGAARAPITAVVILFELTGEYSIILPMMAAIVMATGCSHLITKDTIYTLKLRRRGVDIERADPKWATTTVREVMQTAAPIGARIPQPDEIEDLIEQGLIVAVDDRLGEAARALEASSAPVPVLGSDGGSTVGWLSHAAVLRAVRSSAQDETARDGRSPGRGKPSS